MCIAQFAHRRRAECGTDGRAYPREQIERHVAQPSPESFVQWNFETNVRAVDDTGRQVLPFNFLHPLRRSATYLHVTQQCEGEFHKAVIEERQTQFQQRGHRQPVAALEQVIGEPGVYVRVG
jgi:hypothetical protein